MYLIDEKNENGKRVLAFHGAINSANAPEVEASLNKYAPFGEGLVFDFADVDLISSVGLRIVLKIAKPLNDFELINAVPDVYQVFDMTGFTQIMKVSRAMRVISIEGKDLIGEGYMGRVYRLDPETIIKKHNFKQIVDAKELEKLLRVIVEKNIITIKKEINLAKTALVLGIPTAIPFDVVKVKEGFYGSVFELLNSNCFNKLFIEHPENTDKYVQMYIDLLKEIMAIKIEGEHSLPKKKDAAREWYKYLENARAFEPEVLKKMKALIEGIPDDKHLIHGDYHIKNIMMQGDEPLLIDMDTLGVGHEIFEFTAFFLTYVGYPSTAPGNIKEFLGIEDEVADKLFFGTVNSVFEDRSQEERDAIIDKMALLGYFWLTYKTLLFEPENKVRLDHAKAEVLRLINKVDDLAF